MTIQQRKNEDEEADEIKTEVRSTEKFKAGRQGIEEIREE